MFRPEAVVVCCYTVTVAQNEPQLVGQFSVLEFKPVHLVP